MSKKEKLWSRVLEFYAEISEEEKSEKHGVHLLDHVSRVVQNVKDILQEMNWLERRKVRASLVIAAAMVHDMGYEIDPRDKGKYSAELCSPYLHEAHFAKGEIRTIQEIILAHHDRDHSQKTIEQKILYIADKCDAIGYDGTARMFIHYGSRQILNRDDIAEQLKKFETRVNEDLLKVEVGQRLVKNRWEETRSLLEKILDRKKY